MWANPQETEDLSCETYYIEATEGWRRKRRGKWDSTSPTPSFVYVQQNIFENDKFTNLARALKSF